jgi:hypothetical protein
MTVIARSGVQRRTDLTFRNSQSDIHLRMKVLALEKEIANDIGELRNMLKS